MKIIVNTPLITLPAGVANHYLGLRPFFSHSVVYNQFRSTNYIKSRLKGVILCMVLRTCLFCYDFIKFVLLIFMHGRPVVLLNPSFGRTALQRDVLFLNIAKFLRCKVAVFIHGWDQNYLDKVFRNEIKFRPSWKKADAFFVLGEEFKQHLSRLGVQSPIYLTTTKVNDKLLDGSPSKKVNNMVRNLLFLARIEQAKGIFIVIDAFSILIKKYPEMKLRVVGSGSDLDKAKRYVTDREIKGIVFTGPLFGNDLRQEFTRSDLYILPTTHGEGMPTSVLEAMAFGLPVLTRPVGGLKDFFVNGKMGYLLDSLKPEDYARMIEKLIDDPKAVSDISKYNESYAREHFLASKVAPSLEKILKKL